MGDENRKIFQRVGEVESRMKRSQWRKREDFFSIT
jgi:hypothetical protein